MTLAGHFWTIAAHISDRLRPAQPSGGRPWRAVVRDNNRSIELTGVAHAGERDPAILLVHGLGGSAESGYVLRAAAEAVARGHAVVRLNLRGADRSGADIYHAGLTDDLAAALASPELAGRPVAAVGFSLGGHVTLRFAASGPVRLVAACSICAPLDLAAGADHIDRRRSWVYRRHVFRGLREIHAAAVSAGAPVPLTPAEAASIETLREWDERIVAPRFGFAGAADYYRQMSVKPLLGAIEAPALIAWAPGDPMIPPGAGEPPAALPRSVESRALRPGGHVGFPRRLAVESTILDWIASVS